MNAVQSPQDFSNSSPQSGSSGQSPHTQFSNETTNSNRDAQTSNNESGLQPAGEKRVPLACMRCRAKRARCSGEKPTCSACQKAGEVCTWPAGRKRKRTRKEMEEEERRDREAAAAAQATNSNVISLLHPQRHDIVNGHGGPTYPQVQPVASTSYGGIGPVQNGVNSSMVWPNTSQVGGDPSMQGLHPHAQQSTSNMWNFPMPGSMLNLSYVWPGQPKPHEEVSPPTPLLNLPTTFSASPEKESAQIARALERPMAYIDEDPNRQGGLELYYYRFSGSTAIHPGINRISLKLQPRIPKSAVSAPVATEQSKPGSPAPPEQMFDEAGLPLPDVYLPLLDTFFRTICIHFPSISRKRMEERLETGTMSAFMLNCICAISARFHPSVNGLPADACAPFITKAQELIIPLLHLPTTDVVTGLLLLAWANYGQNSESGQWQYSGMAIRMALDLGLHEVSEIYESLAHVVRTRLLFWSLFVTDRILAFSTGRPPSISEEIIEIPLPTDEDFFPEPSRTNDPAAQHEEVQPVPFQHLVRLLVLCGRIANVLNGRRGRVRTLVGPGVAHGTGVLSELQAQLVQFYAELPEQMKWSVEAFKRQEARGHGGTYLTLHLWANAVMALVYHPGLLANPGGMETPVSSTMDRSIKVALSSSRTISECLVFADLFASQSYLHSPHTTQPIYVACLAFIQDMKLSHFGGVFGEATSELAALQSPKPQGKTAELLLTSMAKQNLTVLMKALSHMEHYWAGVSFVSNLLQEKAQGIGISMGPMRSKKTFISLPDKGLLKRFTGQNLPHSTAPPTETSLATSIRNERAAVSAATPSQYSTYMLDDLLNGYSVEGFYVQPADHSDLESLMNTGNMGETPPGMAGQ